MSNITFKYITKTQIFHETSESFSPPSCWESYVSSLLIVHNLESFCASNFGFSLSHLCIIDSANICMFFFSFLFRHVASLWICHASYLKLCIGFVFPIQIKQPIISTQNQSNGLEPNLKEICANHLADYKRIWGVI